jgi:inosine-uridine nucleoside N-ribohydrolase
MTGDGARRHNRRRPGVGDLTALSATIPPKHGASDGVSRRIHVDTDFAGDPDDACALAMLLGCAEAQVVSVTTALEDGGHRHDCLRRVLEMAGRSDIPSAAGLDRTLTGQRFTSTWNDARHWPTRPRCVVSAPGAAEELLADAIDSGTTILAIGGFTNLAALERSHPGTLAGADVVAMAGWIRDPPGSWPQWGPSMDFNTQCDTDAALVVAGAGTRLTLATLPVAMRAQLRAPELGRLRAAGPIGALLARQSEERHAASSFAALARDHSSLADDLVNFHWDPVAAGVALGWDCIGRQRTVITATQTNGVVVFHASDEAGDDAVSVSIDAGAFEERWMACVEHLAAMA